MTKPKREISQKLKGVLLALIAAVAFASMAGMVRQVSGSINGIEVAFFRNLFGTLMFVPLLLRVGTGPLKTQKLHLLGIRSVCNALSMCLFFVALGVMPLTEVTALNFTIPLFVTIAAAMLLHEKMSPRRWGGLVVGFIGAFIILRPGAGMIDVGAMYVLLSAAVWAVAVVDIKVLGRTELSVTITLYGAIFNALLILPAALFVWTWPSLNDLVWLIGVGVSGTIGHLLYAQALRMADASLVSGFDFTRMIWVSLIGYVFFAEVPDVATWIGAIVIFASATYITLRESRDERARKAAAELQVEPVLPAAAE